MADNYVTKVLVEAEGEVTLERPEHPRERRVKAADGRYLDHVSDAPDGRWIYRESR